MKLNKAYSLFEKPSFQIKDILIKYTLDCILLKNNVEIHWKLEPNSIPSPSCILYGHSPFVAKMVSQLSGQGTYLAPQGSLCMPGTFLFRRKPQVHYSFALWEGRSTMYPSASNSKGTIRAYLDMALLKSLTVEKAAKKTSKMAFHCI